ncbi:protein translocase subunit SecF [Paenibacillus mucilaginosus]|uniref:Protein-export membrane protein SecF n=3 Tax=Paenibacillus mucilaginosus TaxID=61624 RepID=H6NQE5_9BACL|nr:protein translocase subunit SecF [Paenibacillus mucilaginosus]AEI44927.1 preprotein translocase subunit SecF [Paenibacillus mucilaginosus KNP414]AFC32669.1 preprotein translocase subunit SecF [Paenibacillus mucilaginosus 3016]AFH65000.1 preprotein translocase subunit SecF [Paenibacillus mucilaginosus K02]MCG7214967.1 protein translocase subunit SecF [Paenibacillus mucilaginosus]WDM26440.1 protein translocase subunit SecF [Paenibacillus mucilaginosus]
MDYKVYFSFVKQRKYFYMASLFITLLGAVMLMVSGLNYGVDFRAGTSMDISADKPMDKAQAEELIRSAGAEPSTVTLGGENNNRLSVRFSDIVPDDTIKKVKDSFAAAYGTAVSQEVNTVTPDMALELRNKALIAIGVASLAICLYVTIRFEWRFAIASIIAILHDAFLVVSVFAIFQLEVNLPFMAAVLTTIGYSINDKIVIFDRVRENLRFAKLKTSEDVSKLLDDSIWQTMKRNINTVLTVLIAAVCLLVLGSPAIKLFALAKIIGLTSGAYSSVCIAGPLWYDMRNKALGAKKKAAVQND